MLLIMSACFTGVDALSAYIHLFSYIDGVVVRVIVHELVHKILLSFISLGLTSIVGINFSCPIDSEISKLSSLIHFAPE